MLEDKTKSILFESSKKKEIFKSVSLFEVAHWKIGFILFLSLSLSHTQTHTHTQSEINTVSHYLSLSS